MVNLCELFEVSNGCAGMIGEGRKTWMHYSWFMASCPNILGGGGEEEKSEGLCHLSLGVGCR